MNIFIGPIILLTCFIFFSPNLVWTKNIDDTVEVYLLNQLDDFRGYCLDIKGYKSKAQANKGLQAHTCYSYQGNIAVDQGFTAFNSTKKKFFLPAFDVCLEAASTVPSAKTRLRKCRLERLQEFQWDDNGEIHPSGNIKLCLTVAQGTPKKGRGGSPVHLMRDLSLELCSEPLRPYQTWAARRVK
jgi:hypothetical protein